MDSPQVVPVHVSFIMDGNGRWAKARGKERIFGHFEGVESVRAVLEASVEWGIKYVSFFAFSEENWGRPQEEVLGLMSLMMRSMKNELHSFLSNGIRFRVLGNLDRLSDELRSEIAHMEAATASGDKMTMIIFMSYSGKWDIRQAARRMAEEGGEDIEEYLVTAGVPDPDLLIRTSGEQRISNYMLWQLAYTEFVFTPTLWPDFRKEQYLDALREYASRDRRFGKVK
ncbi:MAG: di-trans,poly-cis-decaprenylcistransferase [Bacteroidales bacterium]|nr:di-trans,poly-cis-decaprenylcistransferase [Bacteroidales bacterium]MBQ1682642.1 di-trans,poly-cis-decaprenylcistransferase [Bacteroidales bacterium]MBQ1718629.1 di-trans,poly-cis-decaprenylcistransferase [Bacteroidales bacterium]MBQ2108054.1 di-trans,poly-cis-decaprenylcistransferase [Bacteroidales bacterium]MBQ2228815.1 di-trans,poly-cis-decaprenylcistransferase [Bacteroidales bacterium]